MSQNLDDLAMEVIQSFDRDTPFEQFRSDYFTYKRCSNQVYMLTGEFDVVRDRKMDTLFQTRVNRECKYNGK